MGAPNPRKFELDKVETLAQIAELILRLQDCLAMADRLGQHRAAIAINDAILSLGGDPPIPAADM